MSTMLKEVYDAFISAGAEESKASAAAEAITRQFVDKTDSSLATKNDIRGVKTGFQDLRGAVHEDIQGVREDVHLLDKRLVIVETKLDTVNKLLWIVIAGVAGVLIKAFVG